jgi:hypothetical protein
MLLFFVNFFLDLRFEKGVNSSKCILSTIYLLLYLSIRNCGRDCDT